MPTAAKTLKRRPRPRCRCGDCRRPAERGTVFCRAHRDNCRASPLSGDEPPYNPERYNTNPLVRETHNCWAYGMDVVDPAQLTQCLDGNGNSKKNCQLLYHQPGGTKGLATRLRGADGRQCAVVADLMRADVADIVPTSFAARCHRGSSKIALVVHPGEDYHFYRQDADGWWSHKDGANRVKRYDAEGLPIWDPRTAARDYRPRGSFLNYRDFCGYYCAPRRRTLKLARER